jgi:hypothetical protein
LQKQEPQRPATARPSLLSPASGPGETRNILGDLDGAGGKPSPAAAPARRGRKGLMAGTVLALAALGGTAALVVLDANNVQQVAQVATVARGQGAEAGGPQKAEFPGAVAVNEAGEAAQLVDLPPAAPDAGPAAAGDTAPAPVNGQAAAQALAPATTTAAAAPAVALATALAVPDQASPAAAIVDAAPAPAPPKAVHKVAARERKAAPARAKERQARHMRVAKAKAPERKLAKEKTHRKPLQPKQASPDNDVELLAALVAHTRPQAAAQKGRAAPCGKDSLADNAACGAGVER